MVKTAPLIALVAICLVLVHPSHAATEAPTTAPSSDAYSSSDNMTPLNDGTSDVTSSPTLSEDEYSSANQDDLDDSEFGTFVPTAVPTGMPTLGTINYYIVDGGTTSWNIAGLIGIIAGIAGLLALGIFMLVTNRCPCQKNRNDAAVHNSVEEGMGLNTGSRRTKKKNRKVSSSSY